MRSFRNSTEVAVTYTDLLREMFPDLNPEVDDVFLLEWHQIAALPERAPAPVLHAHPHVRRFLVARHPEIEGFLVRLLTEHGPVGADDLAACEQALVWEIADWIAYQRAPQSYDTAAKVDWDLAAVTDVVALDGKVVIDAGAGTGRVALDAAPVARHLFAVEPVATLRQYLKDKATRLGIDNLYVVDGFLHAIPLPTGTADVLLTCQAIGWNLPDELREIERVTKPGGAAVHVFGTPAAVQPDNPLHQPLLAAGYQPATYERRDICIRTYSKQIGG
jgi:ubiquinone/menaquinone biosynthesis C-methylase UbiE